MSVNCGSGNYFNKNTSGGCSSCPSNMTCDGTEASCNAGYTANTNSSGTLYCCNSTGQYWNGSRSRCESCPSGKACDGSNITGCASGYTANTNSSGTLYCCNSTSHVGLVVIVPLAQVVRHVMEPI